MSDISVLLSSKKVLINSELDKILPEKS
ncbi:MAG: hypothetical protein ACD_79C00710G0003, partial [uncultured bacterium]